MEQESVTKVWQLLIAGGVGAALIKAVESLGMFLLKRKADKKDGEAMTMEELQKKVEKHDEQLASDCAHLKLIDKRLYQSDLAEQALMKAVHALLNHSLTNNASGEMKEARDNLVNFIIDNKNKGE